MDTQTTIEIISSTKIKTLDGGIFELTQEMINNLKMRLKGQFLLPGDPGFMESSSIWNAMIDKKPAIVVRCLGTLDVITSVQFAREHNLLLCIKGGGHNVAGLATAEGAMMLDMSLMRAVWVDTKNKVAHAQAGCLIGDVDRETQLHGLAAVLGFVSMTGITGLTLGGGIGYLTRRFGWTVDTVLGFDVVTAAGKLVHASSEENADLFWGLLGGGGNFGVVTSIDYKLFPVGPEIIGGFIAWPASEAPKVMELYRSVAESSPLELTLMTVIRPAPAAPWIPKEWHFKPIVMIGACYSGDLAAGEKIVAPIKSFGTPLGDVLIRRPYGQLQTLLDAANPSGRRCYWKSEYLPSIQPDLAQTFIEHAAKIPSRFSAAILFQVGGVLNDGNGQHTSAGNREARYLFNLASAWEKSEDDDKNIAWTRQAWNDLKPYSTGGTYLNFLSADSDAERTKAAIGKGMERLAVVKAKWDPDNFFRTNWNIKPAK